MEEMSVLELQEKLASGELTALGLLESYLERIEQIDRHGPALNAVIELNPDAPGIAEALDRERQAGRIRGPLHGIPILIKDNIDTHDHMQTTAGSLALAGTFAARDAFLVKRLRAAGAVIMGKTNLSEWANFRGKHSVSGWSSRGGLTHNPYALDRSACGSSSGSGAAVAANLSALAVARRRMVRSPVHPRPTASWGSNPPWAGQPQRHHPDRAQPGYRRADGAQRGRCGHPAGRINRGG